MVIVACPAPLVAAEPMGSTAGASCAYGDVEVAGRAFAVVPDVGLSRGVELAWNRVELGLREAHDAQVRLALVGVRSGGTTGYVGVDGESWVPKVEIAEVRWDWRAAGLGVAGGLVDDAWVMTTQPAWGLPAIVRPLGTERGWFDRSDAGGWVGWTEREGRVGALVSVTTGEGASRRERNTGVDTTAVVRVSALPSDAPVSLELAVGGREGSRGLDQAPDHRAAAAILFGSDLVAAGVEGILGAGLEGDGFLRPAGISAWVRAADDAPLIAVGRLDVATDRLGTPATAERLVLVAAGPHLPLDGPVSLVLGWEGRAFGTAAAPVAGSELVAGADRFFVQLGARLRGGVETP